MPNYAKPITFVTHMQEINFITSLHCWNIGLSRILYSDDLRTFLDNNSVPGILLDIACRMESLS